MKFVFFGSSDFSVLVLDLLYQVGVVPSLVVTTVDKPQGRKLILTPNPVKVWAQKKGIEVLDPKSLKNDAEPIIERLKYQNADFFLVASYGKIIPPAVFEIPKFKTLNIHPSLLPKYRGASPIISQILNDEMEVGTSIMLIDEGMDTGPVIAEKIVSQKVIQSFNGSARLFSKQFSLLMAEESVSLFLEIIPKWLKGEIESQPQDDSKATECGKIQKEDGLLDLSADPRQNLLKIKAFSEWPRTYFFHNNKRVIVTDAIIDDSGLLNILTVIPEGKKEMPYEDFLRGYDKGSVSAP